jgi:hypothetical protein
VILKGSETLPISPRQAIRCIKTIWLNVGGNRYMKWSLSPHPQITAVRAYTTLVNSRDKP